MLKNLLRRVLEILRPKKVDPLVEHIQKLTPAQKKALSGLLIAVEDMNWSCSVVSNDAMEAIRMDPRLNMEEINPYKNNKAATSRNIPKSAHPLNEESKNRLRKMLSEMGIEDVEDIEFDFAYYDEEDSIFYPHPDSIPNPHAQNSVVGTTARNPHLPVPAGFSGNPQDTHRGPLDSIFNFAVVYLYGSYSNNVVTYFSLDAQGRLFIHEQDIFNITNATQALDMCNDLIERFELDRIFFIETKQSKTVVPYVQRGLEKDNIKIELIKESYSFKRSVQDMVPLMSSGQVFVNNGPWLPSFQNELGAFFRSINFPGEKVGTHTSRLKSLVYGVTVWKDRRESDDLVRDYGITDDTEN